MKAEILSIGTELLLGQIVDTNAAWLAGRLADLGIDLFWVSTVGDNLGRATDALSRALGRSEVIVCTGGLGPTEDDLTREAIAGALGETPAVDAALEAELRAWFARRGLVMAERNRKQAWLIPSARALPNPLGTAPGWLVEKDGRTVVAMPGVPREMTRMWEEEVEQRLAAAAPIRSLTLKLLGIGESAVEEKLADLVRSTAPTVATYAKADGVHVRVTDRDVDPAARDRRIAAMGAVIHDRLGPFIWGTGADTLGDVIGAALERRGWHVATGEALTAGELARALSEGVAARRYVGGVILPGAHLDALLGAARSIPADVLVLTAEAGGDGVVEVRMVDRTERLPFRSVSAAEGRRRGVLTALDLLRRALAS